jgi:hypothetical protein
MEETREKINFLQDLLDGDFASDSPERAAQEAMARLIAKAAGWKAVGSTYRHETKGSYLIREMDGWSDLCMIECLAVEDWIERITPPPPLRNILSMLIDRENYLNGNRRAS